MITELLALSPSAYREYGKWMFQHIDGRKWIGYKVRTYIIEKALKASGKNLIELTTLPTQQLLSYVGV